jgi:3-oxoacyl-[acyl-carrier-protein] synthase-3
MATKLYTNGSNIEALYTSGVGFRRRPYVDHQQLDATDHIPTMEGREVFKQAVSKMPAAVREVCAAEGIDPSAIDVLLVHQANLRIIEAVAKQLGLAPEKVPHNIERYGNTTAGTLPILFHECLMDGTIQPGMLVCFTALGSGLHWGAALYRA